MESNSALVAHGARTAACWVIAWGNPHLGDGGAGACVAGRLKEQLGMNGSVSIACRQYLDMALLQAVQMADHILFVDARHDPSDQTIHWSVVEPNLNGWAMGSQHWDPAAFLGLLNVLYQRQPSAWLVSVPGNRCEAERRRPTKQRTAEKAAVQILAWLSIHHLIPLVGLTASPAGCLCKERP